MSIEGRYGAMTEAKARELRAWLATGGREITTQLHERGALPAPPTSPAEDRWSLFVSGFGYLNSETEVMTFARGVAYGRMLERQAHGAALDALYGALEGGEGVAERPALELEPVRLGVGPLDVEVHCHGCGALDLGDGSHARCQ